MTDYLIKCRSFLRTIGGRKFSKIYCFEHKIAKPEHKTKADAVKAAKKARDKGHRARVVKAPQWYTKRTGYRWLVYVLIMMTIKFGE